MLNYIASVKADIIRINANTAELRKMLAEPSVWDD